MPEYKSDPKTMKGVHAIILKKMEESAREVEKCDRYL